MANGMVATNLELQPGSCVKIVGDIPPDAKCFRFNLGKDELNLALHFNPRFNACDDTNTVVCNSRQEGSWGAEQRENNFPFLPGTTAEVCMLFETAQFTVKLPDGNQITFPNRLNLETINFLQVNGDFKLKSVTFE
ncbi:galectin-1 [Antechinus flavipes]|uniref:galectin-1 n=1 Tax=Antechinus flavipes TaxID=38775 RepID=UPI00223662D1|nr:galectin-1 [Antechinus flavipes]